MTNNTYNLLMALMGCVCVMLALVVLVPNGSWIYLFMLAFGVVGVNTSIRNTLRGK
jgi:hypothetical protein